MHILCILPITLGTLHIDMAIKLATKKQLESLNKQLKRSLIATKLTMKETQIVNQEDVQIVSKIDSIVKVTRNRTTAPFGTIGVKVLSRLQITINIQM